MKFFKNNKAITLIELVTSIAISGILFLIIFVFITNSVEELVNNDVKISSVEQWFEFKDVMQRFIRWWYSDAYVLTDITRDAYTWTTNPNPNNVLYLKRLDQEQWILVWIVDINTGFLQRDYIYWNNFLWYRYLSSSEMTEIDSDPSVIFTKQFTNDRVFQSLRMRDFQAKLFNSGDVVELYFSVINLFDDSLINQDFADFYVDDLVIDEYNLVF